MSYPLPSHVLSFPIFLSLTEDQMKEAQDLLKKLSFKFSKDSMKGRVINDGDITFLGEVNGPKRPEKRHKSNVEKFRRC